MDILLGSTQLLTSSSSCATSTTQLPFRTPLPHLNERLAGGIAPATLTEIYGSKSSFKTQFILTLAVTSALKGNAVIIADADGTAHHVRLLQIACTLANSDVQSVEDAFKRLFVVPVTDWPTFTAFVHMLPSLIAKTNTSFIAIDSMSTLFRTCNESAPSKRLEAVAARLRFVAVSYNLYVVISNGARTDDASWTAPPTASQPSSVLLPTNLSSLSAMGEAWRYAIGTRLYVQRQRDGSGLIQLVKSGLCFQSNMNPIHFQVNEAGITDSTQSSF